MLKSIELSNSKQKGFSEMRSCLKEPCPAEWPIAMSEQDSVIPETQGHRNLLVLLFAGFVLSGIATTIVGPMLPIFIRRWSLDDGQAGLFSSIQFLAALGGTLASSAIAAWRGYRPALVMGYALMGGGLACLNADKHVV